MTVVTFAARLGALALDAARIETRASRLLQRARDLIKKLEEMK